MKKILSNIYTWAALCMMGAVTFTACSSDDGNDRDDWVPPLEPQTYHMTIQATKGEDATTRALTLDESGTKNTLNATWATGEKVYVYNTDKHATLDGYLEAKSDGTTVTLDGNLTGTVDSGDLLVIGFPQVNQIYTGQDGTLATIASTYDYALGWAEVTDVSSGTITAKNSGDAGTTIQFKNQQFIVRFKLLNNAGTSPINAMSLTIEAKDASSDDRLIQTFDYISKATTCGPITITSSPATNVIYAVLSTNVSPTTYNYTLTATDGNGDTYTYTKTGATFEWGKYYEITVKMTQQIP